MLNPEDMMKLMAELSELNKNLAASRQSMQTLNMSLKGLTDSSKRMYELTKQIGILNQIMLQTKKFAGTSGMIQDIIGGLVQMARAAK